MVWAARPWLVPLPAWSFVPLVFASQPGQKPGDTYANLTATFRDCNGKTERLQARSMPAHRTNRVRLGRPWPSASACLPATSAEVAEPSSPARCKKAA